MLSAKVIYDATLLIQFIRSKMDVDENVVDEETVERLGKVLEIFLNELLNI